MSKIPCKATRGAGTSVTVLSQHPEAPPFSGVFSTDADVLFTWRFWTPKVWVRRVSGRGARKAGQYWDVRPLVPGSYSVGRAANLIHVASRDTESRGLHSFFRAQLPIIEEMRCDIVGEGRRRQVTMRASAAAAV